MRVDKHNIQQVPGTLLQCIMAQITAGNSEHMEKKMTQNVSVKQVIAKW